MSLRSHESVKYLTLITTFLVKVLTLNSDAFTYLADNGQRHRDYTVIRAFKLHSCRPCNRARLYGNLQPNCNYFWRVVLLKKKNLQPTSGCQICCVWGFCFFFFCLENRKLKIEELTLLENVLQNIPAAR